MSAKLLEKIKNKLTSGQALIVASTDEFLSEYTPEKYKRMLKVSGFDGSYGFAVISKECNYLFTDGRYLEEAKNSAVNYEIILDDEPNLRSTLTNFKTLLVDGRTISMPFFKRLSKVANVEFTSSNWVDELMPNEEMAEFSMPILIEDEIVGATVEEKLQMILPQIKADYLLLMNPDSVNWLLNIRGDDVDYCGLYNAYLLVSRHGNTNLIRDPLKLDQHLDEIAANYQKVNLDVSKSLAGVVKKYEAIIEDLKDPCELAKAVKNPVELAGFKQAHFWDGLCLIRLIKWLDENIECNITELEISAKLLQIKQEIPDFIIPSFETIAAYGENGCIIHYKPSLRSNSKVARDKLFLLDSGSHFTYGTTDVTRTFHFGQPNDEQKVAYTAVLKGLVDLMMQKFPVGTKERELDSIARHCLWNLGLNYSHSTGHGVGQFLSVHERPNRMNKNSDVEILEHMVVTIEPGYYPKGKWGIRLENTVYVEASEFAGYLQYKTLTNVPFEWHLIEHSMLSDDELVWIILYHKEIFELYKEVMNEEEKLYFQKKYLPPDVF